MSAISPGSRNAYRKLTSGRLNLSLRLFAISSIATFACSLDVARADDALEATCNEIKYEIGNCSCAIEFLTKNVGPKNALILMQGWAIAAGRKGDITGAIGPFYREHDEQEVLQASVSFLKVRIQFYTHCAPPPWDLWDLN